MGGTNGELCSEAGQPLFERRSVADRAYELWLQRGCPSGTELRDWLDAESEFDRASALASVEATAKGGRESVLAEANQGISDGSLAADVLYQRTGWEAIASVFVIDQQGLIVDVSQSAAEMFHSLRGVMLGQQISDVIVAPSDREEFQRDLVRHVLYGSEPCFGVRRELLASRVDGFEFPIELVVRQKSDLQPIQFAVYVRDLSGQKAIEVKAAHFADLVRCSDDSIVGTTLDGTVTSWNQGAEQIYGYSSDEMIGTNISRVFPTERVQELVAILQTIGRGESIKIGDAVRRRKDGRLIDVSLTISPMRDQAGRIIGLSSVARDISERKAIERSRAAEHAVVRVLAESDSFANAKERILQAIGEHLNWSFGAVWEEDPELNALQCISTWCAADAPPLSFERHSRELMLPRGVGLPGKVWESGESCWICYPGRDGNFPRRETALAEQLLSAVAFPVLTRTSCHCIFEFLSRECREPDAVLMQMMAHVSSQIAQFVERRKSDEALHGRQREMEVAREIQQRLLPTSAPDVDGFEIAAATHPAQETGGDLYDFIPLTGDLLGVAIGDASGHGIGAALVIAETRAYLRAFAAGESDPGRLLAETNRCLTDDLGSEFVTLFLARLDPSDHSLTYASAGHWPGYLISCEGEIKAQLSSTGIPLGLQSGFGFPTSRVIRIAEGDLLLLLTDGFVEAASPEGQLFGMDRVLESVRSHLTESASKIVDSLTAELSDFTGGRFIDDRTAVVIKACSSK